MQRVIRWIFGAKPVGFCFRVVAAGAIVFAVALFFADSPKQPTGGSKWGVAGNKPSSGDPDNRSFSKIAADTGRAEPMPRVRKAAPIVDGPAYLAQKAEAEIAKTQASSAVGTDAAGAPHDDGNGIAAAPDTFPAAQPELKASTDLH
jgi:hypothetical protein